MGFLYAPLPLWVALSGWIAVALLCALAIWRKPFARLRSAPLQHLWLGNVVTISALWAFDAWAQEGPVLHLLGAALLVTLFDWELALLGMMAVIGLVFMVFDAPWNGVGITALIYGALPVGVAVVLQRLIAAWLPRQLLIFIFGHGFFSAAASVGAVSMAALGLQMSLSNGGWASIPPGYLWMTLLLASGEAWFTGMLTTLCAVYKPAWLTTYDERVYHRRPRSS